MTHHLVVLGDALIDRDLDGTVARLCPDAPVPVVDDPVTRTRPGGAALAATLAALDGDDVILVTALAADGAGRELAGLLAEAGVEVVPLTLDGPTPEKVRVRAGGRPLLRLDLGARPSSPGALTAVARRAIAAAGAVLVSDYGRGLPAARDVRDALRGLERTVPVVWDPHPRGAAPIPGTRLATPNRQEAALLSGATAEVGSRSAMAAVTAQARDLAARWGAASVAVTLGEGGALLVGPDGPPMAVPASPAPGGDACGAGDRFAATAAAGLLRGALVSEAVVHAVAEASAFVAAGGAGALDAPPWHRGGAAAPPADALALAGRVHAAGGTVVATGGCFDLLHAGHVGMLQAARRLGDCLVVCLNSDASVRRLKGRDRPLQRQADRMAVLQALDCVDAVAVFDEETPVAVLEQLRPDIFAKGGDYASAELPEASALAAWGGSAIVLPYLPGRSTSRLIGSATDRSTSRPVGAAAAAPGHPTPT